MKKMVVMTVVALAFGAIAQGFDRVTSLERVSLRSEDAFSAKAVNAIRTAGYNGVFVNGGAGFGGDAFPVECLVDTKAIPDLMPYTSRRYRALLRQRLDKLRGTGVRPWLCMWCETGASVNPKGNDRSYTARTRVEFTALLRKSPELFGCVNGCRGNRPLCLSHPTVKAFYAELMEGIARTYPEIEGIIFFPGDAHLEVCDGRCPRCAKGGLSQQERMTAHANDVYRHWTQGKSARRFYYIFWNLAQPVFGSPFDRTRFAETVASFAPGMGLAMSVCDIVTREQALGPVKLNQPWGTCNDFGDQFRFMLELAGSAKRPVMAISEISQSEQFDPVCANMPFAVETLKLLRQVGNDRRIDSVCDFWGNRPPFLADASHAVMSTYLANPAASDAEILRMAAGRHYGAAKAEAGVAAWLAFDRLMRTFPLSGWAQRFSFAIGREGARGPLFQPLTPVGFKASPDWAFPMLLAGGQTAEAFYRSQLAWLPEYEKTADCFQPLSADEADRIRLAGRLNVSIGAFVLARELYKAHAADSLRKLIEAEMANRVAELEISARIAPGSGVNPLLVEEDLSNMSLYLSDKDYPDVPDELFVQTPVSLPF